MAQRLEPARGSGSPGRRIQERVKPRTADTANSVRRAFAALWVKIDQKLWSMIGAAFIFDNYPDPVQEGFIRIREGKKVRYFSLDKKRFLKGAWDGGSPFNAGIACVCNDCIKKVGEYSEISGGVGWVINTDGDVVQNLGEILGTFPKKCPIQPRKDSKEWEVYSEKRERERSENGHAENKKPML